MRSGTQISRRGRPRSFNPDEALAATTDLFWQAGFSDTALDDIADATGLKRPSLYAAFGDKEAMFHASLAQYRKVTSAALTAALDPAVDLRAGFGRAYALAIATYVEHGRGCFITGASLVGAPDHPILRELVTEALAEFDRIAAARLDTAVARGELPSDTDVPALAALALSVMHAMSVRARAGATVVALRTIAAEALRRLFPTEGRGRSQMHR